MKGQLAEKRNSDSVVSGEVGITHIVQGYSDRRVGEGKMHLTHQPKGLTFFSLFNIPSSNNTYAENELPKAKKKMFIINTCYGQQLI